MQLSEFRDLLANDGFAATFQTMGQYRTELLRALDGLRAQADARPVAMYQCLSSSGEWVDVTKEFWESAIGTKRRILDTHPEASAPGLSEEVDRQNAGFDRCFEALGFPAHHGFERSWSSLVLEIQRALTRASAATVAEPLKTGGYVTHDQAFLNAAAYEQPWTNHQGASEAARDDASGTGSPIESGAHEYHEHRSGQANADEQEHHCDSGGAGLRSACELSSASPVAAQQQAEPKSTFMQQFDIAKGNVAKLRAIYGDSTTKEAFATMKQAEPGADEREKFERIHCGGNKQIARRNEHGDYVLPSIQDAWHGWQARAAQSGQRAGVVEGYVPVKAETLAWMLGESGTFECPQDQYFRGNPAPFWWRKALRAAIAAPTQQQEGGS